MLHSRRNPGGIKSETKLIILQKQNDREIIGQTFHKLHPKIKVIICAPMIDLKYR